MDQQESLIEFRCALSLNHDQHFLREPIPLPCGDHVCKACLTQLTSKEVQCGICNGITEKSSIQLKESKLALKGLQANIHLLFSSIERDFTQSLASLDEIIANEHINNAIENIRFEIEIRVESLKNQLDELNQQFQRKLNKIKNNIIKDKSEKLLNNYENDRKNFQTELDKLRNDIENKNNLQEERFYDCEASLRKLKSLINNEMKPVNQAKFIPSDIKISLKTVGILVGPSRQVKEIMKNGNTRTIDLPYNPYCICVLPNDTFIVCGRTANIHQYDNDFNLINTINHGGRAVIYATSNNKDRIYMSNKLHRIVMTDLNFNEINVTEMNQFNNPQGLSLSNDHLYICDTGNQRIQKLTDQVQFLKAYKLDYLPVRIKVSNNVACVIPLDLNFTCFYETNNFTLLHKYDGHGGVIGNIDDVFYEYCCTDSKLYCYDDNGKFLDETQIDTFNNLISDSLTTHFEIFNDQIVCSVQHSKKLIVVSERV